MDKVIISSLAALLIIGVIVSRVKYEVVFLKKQLKEVNLKIDKYSEDLKIYNAEWSYLNSPARLEKLCEKYLKNLHPTDAKQILSYQTIINSDLAINKADAFKSYIDGTINMGGN